MSEIDDRLTALWTAEAPPPRDAAFRVAVLERAARRALAVKLAAFGLVCIAGTAGLLNAGPALGDGTTTTIAVSALALAYPLWLLARQRRWLRAP